MSDYEPGTVAVATVRGVPNVRLMRSDDTPTGRPWITAVEVGGDYDHRESEVADLRPLVVLDLSFVDSRNAPRALRELADTHRNGVVMPGWAVMADAIADQIEAQTRPPKPAEPTGLGAVVEDAEGQQYVHIGETELDAGGDSTWVNTRNGNFYSWLAIDVARVLSEGVAS